MPVTVTFPDGSKREVPSRGVAIPSREIGMSRRPPTIIQKPLDDPEWEFEAVLGGYRARPRFDD